MSSPQKRRKAAVHSSESIEAVQVDLDKIFHKTFTYEKVDWSLKSELVLSCVSPKKDPYLMNLKTILNEVKDKLSIFDIEAWHRHTNVTNIAGSVVSTVRSLARPELCTQAWCKFHEILSFFPVFKENIINDHFMQSLHICEAPGAFIASLNHYLRTKNLFPAWKWVANTLNPYYEGNSQERMIADDRFIISSLSRWHFGNDNTGDIMIPKNFGNMSKDGNFALITADGSIDCASNPSEQEAITSWLHYCEYVLAMRNLNIGGTFVIKTFTMFEPFSVTLAYVLCCTFEKVCVHKPGTSKSGNSEVYVICMGFLGLSAEILCKLQSLTGPNISDIALYGEIPESFMTQHYKCCDYFTEHQIEAIEKNIAIYDAETERGKYGSDLSFLKSCFAKLYMTKCNLREIPYSCKINKTSIADNSRLFKALQPAIWRTRHSGTFYERTAVVSEVDRLMHFYVALEIALPEAVQWPEMHVRLSDIRPVMGRKLQKVASTRFAPEWLLGWYNKFLAYRDMDIHPIDLGQICYSAWKFTRLKRSEARIMGEGILAQAMSRVVYGKLNKRIFDCRPGATATIDIYCLPFPSKFTERMMMCDITCWLHFLRTLDYMEEGDCVIIPTWVALTRLGVGMIFLCSALFECLYLLPYDGGRKPLLLILGTGFKLAQTRKVVWRLQELRLFWEAHLRGENPIDPATTRPKWAAPSQSPVKRKGWNSRRSASYLNYKSTLETNATSKQNNEAKATHSGATSSKDSGSASDQVSQPVSNPQNSDSPSSPNRNVTNHFECPLSANTVNKVSTSTTLNNVSCDQAVNPLFVTGSDGKQYWPEESQIVPKAAENSNKEVVGVTGQVECYMIVGGESIISSTTEMMGNENLSAKTTEKENSSAEMVVNKNAAAGMAINENSSAGMVVNENTAAGIVVNENTAAGMFVNENTAAGMVMKENTAAGMVVNENTAAGMVVNENTAAGMVVNENAAAGVVMNENTAAGMVGNENTAASMSMSENEISSAGMILDNNTAAGMVVNENTAAEMVVNENTAAEMVMDENTAAGMVMNENTAAGMVVNGNTAAGIVVNENTAAGMVMDENSSAEMVMNENTAAGMVLNENSSGETTKNGNVSAELTKNFKQIDANEELQQRENFTAQSYHFTPHTGRPSASMLGLVLNQQQGCSTSSAAEAHWEKELLEVVYIKALYDPLFFGELFQLNEVILMHRLKYLQYSLRRDVARGKGDSRGMSRLNLH